MSEQQDSLVGIRSVAVVMSTFNRKQTTVECLRRLKASILPPRLKIHLYVVDDGSDDGTPSAVREYDGPLTLIHGTGNLFWCGAMRKGYEAATSDSHSAYLWMNDDTWLYPDSINRLVLAADTVSGGEGEDWEAAIVVGATQDPKDGTTTYGVMSSHRVIDPPAELSRTKFDFNGNCTLITHAAFLRIGGIGKAYTHYMGDNDYSVRARAAGVPLYALPSYVGTCGKGELPLWKNPNASLIQRWRHMHSPKGCPPWEYAALRRQMDGPLWPISVLKLYLRCFFPRLTSEVSRHKAQ